MDKDDSNNIYEIVGQKFAEYLTVKNYRKTPERYAILNLIYAEQRHFDIDSLSEALTKCNFRVSRGTLYNTLQLLLDCNLVLKHQFGKNTSVYERAYNNDFHHHLLCTNCGKIQNYNDENLDSILKNEKIKYFTPTHYNLNIYGLCSVCAKKLKTKNS
ncbi:MAG: transcriptional repressor [Dysgonamonadaceae bacterium]|jgi:Fur family ferric uptake transcriptional regulator|nr:transcriptional repressor [Dysgonamonadaceae bacterium]